MQEVSHDGPVAVAGDWRPSLRQGRTHASQHGRALPDVYRCSTLVAFAGAMVRARVADSNQDATFESEAQIDVEHVHLMLSPIEVDILVDALRSVGNGEFAERLETILRQGRQPPAA